ncbi:MAG TPA: 50S ribosomal protein L29 [Chloroflexota bacterium]|jgi:large subunit ribosomal protein L29|nr:50S ribosomal protein L29 [Chloroflexota bacterium]
MKASEIRGLTEAELQKRLADSRQELFNLRFQLATRKLENVSRIREVRKDIARILQVAGAKRREGGEG